GECAGRLRPGMHLNEDHFFPEVIDPESGALLPPGELGELVLTTLTRVYKNVKFYKKKFDELGFLPEDCQSLEDLARLPFTTRHDLARAYPYEMFAVPLREVVRIHSSTGSPGNPIVMGYTARDLRHWAKLAARVLTDAGVDRDDVVQVTLSYGLLTSAFGLHYGVEHLGASVIPTGPGGTARQVQVMRDYRTTVLISTPSYALVLADQMAAQGLDPKDLHLKLALLAGEPWTEAERAEIESRLYLTALENYALSEAMGPGVAGECAGRLRPGMHLNDRGVRRTLAAGYAPQRRPLLSRGHRPRERRPAAPRRAGGAGAHHPHPGGHAPGALPHRRPGAPGLRALPLRPHPGPHEPHRRPLRRSGHRQGHQHLSQPGGTDPGNHPGPRARLPTGGGPHRPPGLSGGQDRGAGGPVLR
ncbi:MAG: hypothetical protein NTW80_13825, partial [Deltaproteobacteria bacterium]|nr:hypothetical protein [Deltaproteobacteria bacterium]